MTLIPNSIIRNVSDISDLEKDKIIAFLQGAVYCWCKNKKKQWFSLRELMGGENFYWDDTPLIVLYEKHKEKGKSNEEAIKSAGKDAGWLLKFVINKDVRDFETKEENLTRKYRWL